MKSFVNKIFKAGKQEINYKKLKEDEQVEKAKQSYNTFMDAAAGTLSMARDVTVSLRDRIDDYTRQIEATSLVIPDALILLGPNNSIENANLSAEKIFARSKQELVNLSLSDLFESDCGSITIEKIKKLYKNNLSSFELVRQGELEIRGLRADLTKFYPNIKVSEFIHSDGTPRVMLLVQDITENVLQEQRFLGVFENQNAIIKALPDILVTIDSHLNILDVSNQSSHTLITEANVGLNLSNIFNPEQIDLFKQGCSTISVEKPLVTWALCVDEPNGSQTHYEVRAIQKGRDILVILRDETDVVLTREELLESEEHFRVFGQASNEAMMIHDENGLLDWNPRLGEMTGFSYSEISKMRAEDFIHPLERHRFLKNNECPNTAFTTLFWTKSGNPVEVAVNEREIDWKNKKARIKVIRDITHLKDVEQLLHLSRERYKTMTDNTFDVVCCYGKDLKLNFINQTFYDYFVDKISDGMTLTDIVDIRDHTRLHDHLFHINIQDNVKRTLYRVSRNGETRWLDWIDRAIYDELGEFIEVQGIGRDVTDYVRKSKAQ